MFSQVVAPLRHETLAFLFRQRCHVFSLKSWKSYPTGHKEKSGSKPYDIGISYIYIDFHIHIYILIYKYNINDMSYSQDLGERRVVFETSLFFEIELGFGKG